MERTGSGRLLTRVPWQSRQSVELTALDLKKSPRRPLEDTEALAFRQRRSARRSAGALLQAQGSNASLLDMAELTGLQLPPLNNNSHSPASHADGQQSQQISEQEQERQQLSARGEERQNHHHHHHHLYRKRIVIGRGRGRAGRVLRQRSAQALLQGASFGDGRGRLASAPASVRAQSSQSIDLRAVRESATKSASPRKSFHRRTSVWALENTDQDMDEVDAVLFDPTLESDRTRADSQHSHRRRRSTSNGSRPVSDTRGLGDRARRRSGGWLSSEDEGGSTSDMDADHFDEREETWAPARAAKKRHPLQQGLRVEDMQEQAREEVGSSCGKTRRADKRQGSAKSLGETADGQADEAASVLEGAGSDDRDNDDDDVDSIVFSRPSSGRVMPARNGATQAPSRDEQLPRRSSSGRLSRLASARRSSRLSFSGATAFAAASGKNDDDPETADGLQSELALASSSRHRRRPSQRQSVGRLYRQACAQLDCVPSSAFESVLSCPTIDVRSQGITDDGATAIAQALECVDTCEYLGLPENLITAEGAEALASLVEENRYINALDLTGNDIRSKGLNALAAAMEHGSGLQSLTLNSNNFLDLDVKRLCDTLKGNDSLHSLSLSNNRLSNASCVQLGRMLTHNSGLEELDLSWNCIQDIGIKAIAQSLVSNVSLQKLNLKGNGIYDAAAGHLASVIKNSTTLTWLDLSHNNIRDKGAGVLAAALKTAQGIEHISLAHNPLSAHGVKTLLYAIAENANIRSLNFDGLPLDEECKSLIDTITAARSLRLSTSSQRPSSASHYDELRDTLLALKSRYGSSSSVMSARRRSSIAAQDVFVRRPSVQYSRRWSREEAWQRGYNADGSPRIDDQWLASRDEFNPDWTAMEAWQHGYHPDGTIRNTSTRTARRHSRMNLLTAVADIRELFEDSNNGLKDKDSYVLFEQSASSTFQAMYPNLLDPMSVLEDYVEEHNLRLVDLFFQLDKDKSGTISVDEMVAAVSELGLRFNEIQAEELVFRLDLNDDGEIDYHEFVGAREALYAKRHGYSKPTLSDLSDEGSEDDDDDEDDDVV